MLANGTRVRSYDDIEDLPGVEGEIFNPMTDDEKTLFVGSHVLEVWYWVLTDPKAGTTYFFAESELEELS